MRVDTNKYSIIIVIYIFYFWRFKKKTIINKNYIKTILLNNFNVRNIKASDVLVLSFISNNPKISQLALKNIISSYQRYEVDSKIEITSYANLKVKERLKELKVQMSIADKNLAKYKKYIHKKIVYGSL